MSEKESPDIPWERKTIEKILLSSIREQQRARRWNIFFRLLIIGYLIALLVIALSDGFMDSPVHTGNHTAVIDIDDVIASEEIGISADNVLKGVKAAYKSKGTKGIVLRINSPGGSPVQSARIFDGVKRLKQQHSSIPVYAVIEDVGASGAYYIAAIADEIYANESSIVGSIGVRMDSFGVVDAMEKLGIERRLLTAGEHKGFLDPFQPINAADVTHVQQLLDDIHEQFIDVVKTGRGDKLKDDPAIFSGFVWTGEQAVDLGLVDELASSSYVAREVIGAETIVDYTPAEDLLEKFSKRLGTALGRGLGEVLGVDSQLR